MRKSENEQHVICKLDFAKLWCKKTYIKCENAKNDLIFVLILCRQLRYSWFSFRLLDSISYCHSICQCMDFCCL